MKKNTFTVVFVVICLQLFSQSFEWKSELDTVSADGFYKIELSPAIINNSEYSFSDLRIYSDDSLETPYSILPKSYSETKTVFKEYEIVSKESLKRRTNIIVHNKNRNKINNFCLIIKNTDVTKSASISGSDDKNRWFVVKDFFLLQSLNVHRDTTVIHCIDFPVSNYEYLKIEINDSLNLPINVLQAGYYENYSVLSDIFQKLEKPTITQKDSSDKHSYIKITFSDKQRISKLVFNFDAPEYFYRTATIGLKRTITEKKHTTTYFETLNYFELKSGNTNEILLNDLYTNELWLVVNNNDNPPLSTSSIEAFQEKQYLFAHLKKDKRYCIYCGNDSINPPVYDIAFFKDSTKTQNKIVHCKEAKNIAKAEIKEESKTFFTSPLFIWLAIGAVVILLLFMTVKVIKDMKN